MDVTDKQTPSDSQGLDATSSAAREEEVFDESCEAIWKDLVHCFARGTLVHVDAALDLQVVADAAARDDAAQVRAWMAAGEVVPYDIERARPLMATPGARFMMAVREPLVLVQRIPGDDPVRIDLSPEPEA